MRDLILKSKYFTNEEIDQMIPKAQALFYDGWSLPLAMCKAGFSSSWTAVSRIKEMDIVKKMIAENRERFYARRTWKMGPK